MRGGRRKPAQDVEHQEPDRPHAVLDVVPEHPPEQTVSEQVPTGPREEQRGQGGERIDWLAVDEAGHGAAEGKGKSIDALLRQLPRDETGVSDTGGEANLVEPATL